MTWLHELSEFRGYFFSNIAINWSLGTRRLTFPAMSSASAVVAVVQQFYGDPSSTRSFLPGYPYWQSGISSSNYIDGRLGSPTEFPQNVAIQNDHAIPTEYPAPSLSMLTPGERAHHPYLTSALGRGRGGPKRRCVFYCR